MTGGPFTGERLLVQGGRVIDPASGRDETADVLVAGDRIVAIGPRAAGFEPARVLDARGCIVAPGLVDLCARLREPGHGEGAGLESELAAAAAGGVTGFVCPPDTDPVLDEPGLVERLKFRARRFSRCRLFPLGALTRGLEGKALAEMGALARAGCVGFSMADRAIADTQVLWRALQYAASVGVPVWLRPIDAWLGRGVAASGAVATRLGLAGVPVAAETIALATIVELVRATGARVHLMRLSSAAGVELVRRAKAEGLPLTADVSVHSLHLTDVDIGHFDADMRLDPPLRQDSDRRALRRALADGTIDALVSDHDPVPADAKQLPFGEAAPGATAIELLLSLALRWAADEGLPLATALSRVGHDAVAVLGDAIGSLAGSAGRVVEGGVADLCVFDPGTTWAVEPQRLASRGRHTPFAFGKTGMALPGRVRATLVAGGVAYEAR
jgi:dihydroorotase